MKENIKTYFNLALRIVFIIVSFPALLHLFVFVVLFTIILTIFKKRKFQYLVKEHNLGSEFNLEFTINEFIKNNKITELVTNIQNSNNDNVIFLVFKETYTFKKQVIHFMDKIKYIFMDDLDWLLKFFILMMFYWFLFFFFYIFILF